jgi:hypothetical protein
MVMSLVFLQKVKAGRETELRHLASYISDILHRYFSPRRAIVLSIPSTEYYNSQQKQTRVQHTANPQTINFLLQAVNEETQDQVFVCLPTGE